MLAALKQPRTVVLAVAALVALFFSATLRTYPAPSCDETGYGASAVALRDHGRVDWSLVLPAGDPFGRDANMAAHGRLYALGLAAVLQLFGVSLWAARAFSVLGWALAALLTYHIGARIFDRLTGAAAALLFATTTKALLTAHTARPETWVTTAALLAVWAALALLQSERRALLPAAGVGALAVLPGDVHGNGFAITAAIGLVVLIRLGAGQKRWQELIAFGGGAFLAGALWALLHLGASVRDLGQLFFYTTFAESGESLSVAGRLLAFVEWLRLTFWVAGGPLSLLELLLAVAGAAFGLRRGGSARMLSAIALLSLGVFAAGYSQRFVQYALLWSPFWFILGAGALRQFAATVPGPRWRQMGFVALASALLAAQLAGDAWLVYRYRDGRYDETFNALASAVPSDARVIADMTWWWALRDGRAFMADEYVFLLGQTRETVVRSYLGAPTAATPAAALPALLDQLAPDYLVIDRATGCNQEPGAEWAALEAYARRRCELVDEIAGAWVGDPGRATSQFAQVSSVFQCAAPEGGAALQSPTSR